MRYIRSEELPLNPSGLNCQTWRGAGTPRTLETKDISSKETIVHPKGNGSRWVLGLTLDDHVWDCFSESSLELQDKRKVHLSV